MIAPRVVPEWLTDDEWDRFTTSMQLVESLADLWSLFPYASLGQVISAAQFFGIYDYLILGDRRPIGHVGATCKRPATSYPNIGLS